MEGHIVLLLEADGCPEATMWIYPSWVNFTTFVADVIELVPEEDHVRVLACSHIGAKPLRLRWPTFPAFGSETWWWCLNRREQFFDKRRWKLTFYSLATSRAHVLRFVPGDVAVNHMGTDSFYFWEGAPPPGPKPRRRPQQQRRRRGTGGRGDGNGGDPPLCADAHESEVDGGVGHVRVGDVDDAANVADAGSGLPAEVSEFDPEETLAPEFVVGGDSAGEAEEDDQWQQDVHATHVAAVKFGVIDEEDSDLDVAADLEGCAGGDGDDQPGEVGEEDDVPLPDEDLAPEQGGSSLAEPPPPAGIPDHVPRNARRPTFPQAVHPSWNGYLRLSQTKDHDHKDGQLRTMRFGIYW